MSRTRRRPWSGSKRFDRSCRSHGGCPWCRGNRLHKHRRQMGADMLHCFECGAESRVLYKERGRTLFTCLECVINPAEVSATVGITKPIPTQIRVRQDPGVPMGPITG